MSKLQYHTLMNPFKINLTWQGKKHTLYTYALTMEEARLRAYGMLAYKLGITFKEVKEGIEGGTNRHTTSISV